MSVWADFFVTSSQGTQEWMVPLARASRGAERIAAAAVALGTRVAAEALARRLGAYRLDEKLAHALKLEGVSLSPDAELPELSPPRWLTQKITKPLSQVRCEWHEEGLELKGVLLTELERDRFFTFLRASGAAGMALEPWEMAEVYEHFCFHRHSSMILLAATRPRV